MLADRTHYEDALLQIPQSEHISENAVTRDDSMTNLAGFLPVYQEDPDDMPLVMLMRPPAKKPDLPKPQFQLCKGTRMVLRNGQWHDIDVEMLPIEPDAVCEPLAITALREGEEEVGLKLDNIITMASVGIQPFISSSTGHCKYMKLYVGAIKDPDAFHALSDQSSSTAERRWVSPLMMRNIVKPDHIDIILPALKAVGFSI